MIDIIGTSHVSEESVEEVREKIKEKQPDVVCVELDKERYRKMMNKNTEIEEDQIKEVITKGGAGKFLTQIMLQLVQGIMGKNIGVEPGSDMKTAIETAQEENINVKLIDRNLNTTFSRLLKNLRIRDKLKILGMIIYTLIFFTYMKLRGKELDIEGEINYENMAKKPDKETTEMAIQQMKDSFPRIYEILIDERDRYMAKELKRIQENNENIIAVVGAGHEPGIKKYLKQDHIPDFKKFNKRINIPIGKIIGILIPISIITLFFLMYMGGITITTLLFIGSLWILINGIPAFILTYLAGGKLSSSLIGGSIAWFSSINPMLAPGWIVGYLEFKYHNIKKTDINELKKIAKNPPKESAKDNIKEMLKIPTFRLLTIIACTNIGSLIGTILFFIIIIPYLQLDIGIYEVTNQGFKNTLEIISSYTTF